MKAINKRFRALVGSLVVVLLASPQMALACSVCYGEPNSPAAKGLTWAIMALASIVGVVLSGLVMFFVHANKNAKKEGEREL